MKHLFHVLSAAAALSAAACSSAPEAAFLATPAGVGPVQLNTPADELPAACDGLYDTIVAEQISDDYEGDYTILHFTLDGKEILQAYPDVYNQKRPLYSITVLGQQVATAEGFGPGSSVEKLFEAGGKASMSNDGMLGISLGGMEFIVNGLKEAANMKLNSAYRSGKEPQIGADDFESNAVVEQIRIY